MGQESHAILAALRNRLQATLRRSLLAELAFGVTLTGGILLLLWLLLSSLEAGLWLPPVYRDALFFAFIAAAFGLCGWYLVRPALRYFGVIPTHSEEQVAERVGDAYPQVSDRLLTLLQLAEGRASSAPAPFVDRAVSSLGKDVEAVPFERMENFGKARRASRFAMAPVLGVLLFLLAAPGVFLDASHRLLSPGAYFQRPAPFQLSVTPGAAQVVQGDSLVIAARAAGEELPAQAQLAIQQDGETHVEYVALASEGQGRFSYTLRNIRAPFSYRILAEPVATQWYEVGLHERPLLSRLQVNLNYPAYTRLPDKSLPLHVGDVSALPGTRVEIDAGLSGAVAEKASVVFDDGMAAALELEGDAAGGAFTLSREGSYHVLLESAEGIKNKAPIEYELQLTSDAAPSIALLAPRSVAELDDAMSPNLHLHLTDDYGFAALRLYYRLAESRYGDTSATFEAIDLPLDEPRRLDQLIAYQWLIRTTTPLDLVPGDLIEYYVQVWDNDAVAGYKSARTPTQRFVLPSLAEKYEHLEERQETTRSHLENLMENAEQLSDQFEELQQSLRRTQQPDWEDQRQVSELQQRQQQMQQQAEQLTRSLDEMMRTMEQNNLVEPQTMELYRELQEVVQEIQTPELQEALKQLQQALEDINPRLMQEALQNFEFSEEQYRQRLERTLSLFKKMKMQQELGEMARRAQELAEREEQLAERTEELQKKSGQEKNGQQSEQSEEQREGQQSEQSEGQQGEQPSEQNQGEQTADERERLARDQEQARKQLESLKKELQELQKQMQQSPTSPKEGMQKLMQQMQQQMPSRKMQQNQEALRQNQLQKAKQGQQQLQQQFQQMQQQLQQMQQQMQGKQRKINLAGLRSALSDVLQLSSQQENLQTAVSDAATDSPQLRAYARRQSTMSENLTTVADSLQKLAKSIPQMRRAVQEQAGSSLQSMQEATTSLTDRQANVAAGLQKRSMMHLNELALMLANLLEELRDNGGGQGGGMSAQQMRQKMQQMAGQQQQLNKMIQQLLNDMQGQRLSGNQQKRLQQLAQQQEALRKQLQQMSQNKEAASQLLGDLQRIAQQMKESIEEMRQRNISRETVQRQRQILQRLLDAQRSIRKQGQSNKRKSTTGETFEREGPGELPPSQEEVDRLRRALIRAIESGYAPEYEELIKRYFRLLQEMEEEAPLP